MDGTWRRVDVGGLAFRVVGEPRPGGTRPPVVLVHGIGASHRYLSRLHDALERQGTVWSIDVPGHGGLPAPPHDVDVAGMARALGVVVARLGASPVVLVGHSMGAQWAVELAVQRPELIAHVVMIGPVTDAAHRTLGAQFRALAVETLLESWTANGLVFADYVRCGPSWYLTQARHMVSYRLEERVPLLAMPLLVMRGSHDPIAGRQWCRLLRDSARQGALVEIPRRHHVVQHTAPRAVCAAIQALAMPEENEKGPRRDPFSHRARGGS